MAYTYAFLSPEDEATLLQQSMKQGEAQHFQMKLTLETLDQTLASTEMTQEQKDKRRKPYVDKLTSLETRLVSMKAKYDALNDTLDSTP